MTTSTESEKRVQEASPSDQSASPRLESAPTSPASESSERVRESVRMLFDPRLPSKDELRGLLYDEPESIEAHERLVSRLWAELDARYSSKSPGQSQEAKLSPSDRRYMIHVAWRLTRFHMHLTGNVSRIECLDDPNSPNGLLDAEDWYQPHRIRETSLYFSAVERQVLRADPFRWKRYTATPLPYTPPTDPELLDLWLDLYEHLMLVLRVPESRPTAFILASNRGVIRMFESPHDPAFDHTDDTLDVSDLIGSIGTASTLWPSPVEIIDYENWLISEFRKEVNRDRLEFSPPEWCRMQFGLSLFESKCIQKGYRAIIKHEHAADLDEIQASQLEAWRRNGARAALDPRAKAIIDNRIDCIHGLGRGETQDINAEFVRIVDLTSKTKIPKRPDDAVAPKPCLPGEARPLELPAYTPPPRPLDLKDDDAD